MWLCRKVGLEQGTLSMDKERVRYDRGSKSKHRHARGAKEQ